MENILLVDKPKGITSFDVIRELRKKLGIRKMGHAGTLDPLATGLLIIGIGEGTKKLNEYLKLPKTYEAEILLGASTDTDDLEGVVIESAGGSVSEEQIRNILSRLLGVIDLQVPLYSAIKVDGKPLYKYAREGVEIAPPTRSMEIRDIEYISLAPTTFSVDDGHINLSGDAQNGFLLSISLDVGSGTYIRSIAREIGDMAGISATLANLRRTTIGDFSVKDATSLEDV